MDFLTTNNVVESLNLKCNRLGFAAANGIAMGLRVNQTLKTLNLSRNPFLAAGCLVGLQKNELQSKDFRANMAKKLVKNFGQK